jgi:hypothetical protein
MDRHYTDLKVCREGIDATVKNIEEDFKEEVEKVEEKNAMTQNELAKWLNRGIGAWALASVLLIVLQAAGAYVVNGIVDAGVKTDERMTRMEVRMLENEKRYIDVMSLAKSQHPELMDLKVK